MSQKFYVVKFLWVPKCLGVKIFLNIFGSYLPSQSKSVRLKASRERCYRLCCHNATETTGCVGLVFIHARKRFLKEIQNGF